MLTHSELLELKRCNTPTIYNGWEQITSRNPGKDGLNLEETRDFMPQMEPMIGYAVTVKIEPSNPEHPKKNPNAWKEYRQYVGSIEGPKIVVVQDLDKPHVYGAFWGEVNSNIHRALGCVGTITDGPFATWTKCKMPVLRLWPGDCALGMRIARRFNGIVKLKSLAPQ